MHKRVNGRVAATIGAAILVTVVAGAVALVSGAGGLVSTGIAVGALVSGAIVVIGARRRDDTLAVLGIAGLVLTALTVGGSIFLKQARVVSETTQAACSLLTGTTPVPATLLPSQSQGNQSTGPALLAGEIDAQYPTEIGSDGSEVVTLSIVHLVTVPLTPTTANTGKATPQPTPEPSAEPCLGLVPGQTTKPADSLYIRAHATPIALGTPGVPLAGAFGPDYDAFATASLVSSAFTQTPSTPEAQSMDDASSSWEWAIKPTSSGRQALLIDLNVTWRLQADKAGMVKKGMRATIDHQIWHSDPLYVSVKAPQFTIGTFDVGNMVTTLALGTITAVTAALGVGLKRIFEDKKAPPTGA